MRLCQEIFVLNARAACSIGGIGLCFPELLLCLAITEHCNYRRSGVLRQVRPSTFRSAASIATSTTFQTIGPTSLERPNFCAGANRANRSIQLCSTHSRSHPSANPETFRE